MGKTRSKINLMYLLYAMNNGGAETLAIRLAEKLDKNIFSPSICSLSDQGPLRELVVEKGIPFYSLGKKEGKDFGVALRVKKLLEEKNITLIHTHNQGPLLYTYLGTLWSYKPAIVHTEHINMTQETSYSPRHVLYNKLIYHCLDGFISIAKHLTDEFTVKYNLSSAKVATIHNSIDLSPIPESCEEYLCNELGLDPGDFLLGNISALRPQKDHATLIKAMEIVVQKYSNTHLVIVGEGELESELKRLVHTLNLERNISFLGYRSDIKNLLLQFDLFVLPSLYEGLPLCILEAMEAGRPIVATNVEGTNELVRHGQTGLLTPAKDQTAMANAICSMISDRKTAAAMGKNARTLVEEEYDFDRMIKKYEDFYQNILGC